MARSRNRRRKRTRRKKGGDGKQLGADCKRHMLSHSECADDLDCYHNQCIPKSTTERQDKECIEVGDYTSQMASFGGVLSYSGEPREAYDTEKKLIKQYPHCDYKDGKYNYKNKPPGLKKLWADREKEEKRNKKRNKKEAAMSKKNQGKSAGVMWHGTLSGGKTRRKKRRKKRRKRSKKKRRRRRKRTRK